MGFFYFISKKRNCFGAVLLLVISFHPVLPKETYQKEKEKKMHTHQYYPVILNDNKPEKVKGLSSICDRN